MSAGAAWSERTRSWAAAAGCATLLGIVLGVLGPFGSYLNHGFLLRPVYWIGAVWIGLPVYGAAVAVSRAAAAPGSRLHWTVLILSTLIVSVPQTALTRALAFALWPELPRFGPGWTIWYLQVAAIGLVTVTGSVMLRAPVQRRRQSAASEQATTPRPVSLLGCDVIALQMEDHYVRVHTPGRSELILMPLGHATAAVASIEGLRTHRSWWVARHAVERIEGSPRSMRVHLSNGLIVPVSRNAVASLRAAGWLGNGGEEVVVRPAAARACGDIPRPPRPDGVRRTGA